MVLLLSFLIVCAGAFFVYVLVQPSDKPVQRQEQNSNQQLKVVIGGGNSDASVQNLKYFCINDKGYHVSIWPKEHNQFDIVEFNIAGLSYCKGIAKYLGEFAGTLEAEPTNQYDSNAIKVIAPDGHHIGYVPRDMTREVRKAVTLPCSCFCYICKSGGFYFSDCYILRKIL
jgi:hypothetical protein